MPVPAKGPDGGCVLINEDVLLTSETRLTAMSTTEDGVSPPEDPLGRRGLPPKVSLLRSKLSQKAKQQPRFRFYALYDRIYRPDVLRAAYQCVRKEKTAPGVDGVTFAALERSPGGVDAFLDELHQSLRSKTYKPAAVRRVEIPKPDGRMRPLGIPTIRDRVVQMATLLVVEPIFEADFRDSSYGFRPGRSAHDALDAIRDQLGQGRREVYDADLQGYFDTIPHDKLLKALEARISDRSVLRLFRMWLQSPIEQTDARGKRTRQRPAAGTPQGGVISPLLANVYLHWFEVLFYRADGPGRWADARLVRYADDFVVLARRQTDALHEWIEQTLEKRFGLTINRSKTKVVRLGPHGPGLDFLGFTMQYRRSRYAGHGSYLHVGASSKALQRVREKLRKLTEVSRCHKPAPAVIAEVNQLLTGWSSYFGYGHPAESFHRINFFTYERLRRHLRRRSQRGYRPPADRSFYAHLATLGAKWLGNGRPTASASSTKRLR